MKIKAYAKINWHLAVEGRRADGYHELDMVMQRVDLFDLLEIEPAEGLHGAPCGKGASKRFGDSIGGTHSSK
jgi:4-diphosphocytidyl-2-C-methyl-D-erythritol kinase